MTIHEHEREHEQHEHHEAVAAGWFEPCAAFDGRAFAPLCAVCGWLDDDHDTEAEVVLLPPVEPIAMPRAS
jgi:hypothetical protein